MVVTYRAEVRIELKPGVADPEGANTKKALELLGFKGVKAVKTVHAFSLDIEAASEAEARAQVDEMCKRLLVNPVVHVPNVVVETLDGGRANTASMKKV
ncbi:MAG TPA: phosphoribosylformylglycinamidine synthase subunit PurS [Candidatus Thermoplasmatota archaeon]|nr:phosphoribosylformylglycinamidine synthase subunit PurS [Candidatus Thermoplasmatota archaeon]